MRQSARFLQVALPDILGRHLELLSPRMARVIANLSGELRHLNERLDEFTPKIETLVNADHACQRLMTMRGTPPHLARIIHSGPGNRLASVA